MNKVMWEEVRCEVWCELFLPRPTAVKDSGRPKKIIPTLTSGNPWVRLLPWWVYLRKHEIAASQENKTRPRWWRILSTPAGRRPIQFDASRLGLRSKTSSTFSNFPLFYTQVAGTRDTICSGDFIAFILNGMNKTSTIFSGRAYSPVRQFSSGGATNNPPARTRCPKPARESRLLKLACYCPCVSAPGGEHDQQKPIKQRANRLRAVQ